ncbi:hypothetical protein MHJ94_10740 [Chryseobacterium taklimakanense]|uniref:hypothetical protein n=1 Tax=Chryseobacterium taklimakanense TaxID=536441 RepID=UPI001EF5BFB6|nr:hypothetical protein [Chryseobacterium taklimakanense]MCG7281767.1 hypothetical protein [Chryseobacterium taklimakanense]
MHPLYTPENYEKLENVLKDAPSLFRENTLKNFERMRFTDQEDFEDYLKETAEDLAEYYEETENGGKNGGTDPQPTDNQLQ